MSEQHDLLVQKASGWLRKVGCRVILTDPFRTNATTGEQPDAIGWRDGLSILVEAKVSLSDFRADRRKKFRIDPVMGMGDWRFFIAPAGLLDGQPLPAGWGLLTLSPAGRVQVASGGPGESAMWWTDRPFVANTREETRLLVSALAHTERPVPIARRGMADFSAWNKVPNA